MAKHRYALIVLIIGVATAFFVNLGGLNLPEQVKVRETTLNKLKPDLVTWAEAKPTGAYLVHTKGDKLNKYLLYYHKEAGYSFATALAELQEGTLKIIITTQDALSDEQCKNKQVFMWDLMDAPEKILLMVDGQEKAFDEILIRP